VAGWDTGAVGGHRVSSPDFVGRGEELDVLTAAYASARAGQSTAVLIGGDAGIGKTRLLDEFSAHTRESGALVVTGVCVPIDGGLPYGPVAGILRDIGRQLGDDAATRMLGPLAEGLGSAASEFGVEAAIGAGRHTEDMAKTRLFESILSAFTKLAAQQPLVVIVDDLQWADSSSAELVTFLVRNLDDAAVLIVGAYRSEDVGADHQLRPWLVELGRHARVTNLHLGGLGQDELTALVGAILGHQPDWALADAVWNRSQGNPFFAEELTAAGPSPTLPPELERVIMARVAALSPKTQQVLRLAAVAGTTAEHRLLAAVAEGFDADALDAALAEAVDRQLLVVDDDRSGYRFRHALVREALAASLLPGERARLHRQVASALVADRTLVPVDAGHRATELATHWWEAGEWTEALEASTAAADAAAAMWAYPEAYGHLERALAAVARLPADGPPDLDTRLELLERAADLAYLVADGARAVELIRSAIDGAGSATDPATLARRYAMLGRNTWSIGDSKAAFDAYARAESLLPADPPSAELARVMAEQARGLMLMARYRDCEPRALLAIATARAVGASAEEGHALYSLGCSRALLGFYDEGIGLIRESLAIAEELASPDDLNRAYMGLSNFLVETGKLEDGAALVFDSAAVGEELWGVRLNGAAGNGVEAFFRLGRYDDAEELLNQTGARGVGNCVSQPALLRTALDTRRGRLEEARRSLTIADETSAALDDVQTRGWFHMLSAELALEEQRPDDGWEQVERALALAAGTDDETTVPEMCALGVRALADRFVDAQTRGAKVDVDKFRLLARGLADEAQRLVEAPVARGGESLPRARAFASMCIAEESRLSASDADLWGDAATCWEAADEPHPLAYCRWRQADALLAGRSGRGAAVDALQSAWAVSVRIGADPLRERVEDLARRARIELRDVDEEDASPRSTLASDLGLTPREIEVLAQLAAGKTDKEIADDLFISKKTASVHVSNLLRKLDVANRVEAGRIGQAHGLG